MDPSSWTHTSGPQHSTLRGGDKSRFFKMNLTLAGKRPERPVSNDLMAEAKQTGGVVLPAAT